MKSPEENQHTTGSACVRRFVRLLAFAVWLVSWIVAILLAAAFLYGAVAGFIDQWPASGIGVALAPIMYAIGYGLYRSIKWARKIRETNTEGQATAKPLPAPDVL
jgi:hypothetical protein